jgi:hypothetical protein
MFPILSQRRKPTGATPPPIYSPALDFSDAQNSQYVYELLEDWFF